MWNLYPSFKIIMLKFPVFLIIYIFKKIWWFLQNYYSLLQTHVQLFKKQSCKKYWTNRWKKRSTSETTTTSHFVSHERKVSYIFRQNIKSYCQNRSLLRFIIIAYVAKKNLIHNECTAAISIIAFSNKAYYKRWKS